MRPVRSIPALLVVRARLAGEDVQHRLARAAAVRLGRLRDAPESGAQAAEYAMLGGVSAAACSALIAIVRRPDFLQRVVEAVVGQLVTSIRGWF